MDRDFGMFMNENFGNLLNRHVREGLTFPGLGDNDNIRGLQHRRGIQPDYEGHVFDLGVSASRHDRESRYHPVSLNRDGSDTNQINNDDGYGGLYGGGGLRHRHRRMLQARQGQNKNSNLPKWFEEKMKKMITEEKPKLVKPKLVNKKFITPPENIIRREDIVQMPFGQDSFGFSESINEYPSMEMEESGFGQLNIPEVTVGEQNQTQPEQQNEVQSEVQEEEKKDDDVAMEDKPTEEEVPKVEEIPDGEVQEEKKDDDVVMEDKPDEKVEKEGEKEEKEGEVEKIEEANVNKEEEKKDDDVVMEDKKDEEKKDEEKKPEEKKPEEEKKEVEKKDEEKKEEEPKPRIVFPIDPAFISALPDGIRQEIIIQNLPSLLHTSTDPNSVSTISSDFLDQLPENVRNEVTQQENALLRNQRQLYESFDVIGLQAPQTLIRNGNTNVIPPVTTTPPVVTNPIPQVETTSEQEPTGSEINNPNTGNESKTESVENPPIVENVNTTEITAGNETVTTEPAPPTTPTTPTTTETANEEPATITNSNPETTPVTTEQPATTTEQTPTTTEQTPAPVQNPPQTTPPVNDTDPATFIASLPQNLREEVLSTMDDATLHRLPPEIVQEAMTLRRGAYGGGLGYNRPRIGRGGGFDFGGGGRGTTFLDMLRREEESLIRGTRGGTGGVGHVNFQLTKNRKGDSMFDNKELNSIIQCLYMQKNYPKIPLCEIFEALIKMKKQRRKIFCSLMGIMMYNVDQSYLEKKLVDDDLIMCQSFNARDSFKEVNDLGDSKVIPKIVIQRILNILTYLQNQNNRFTYMFLRSYGLKNNPIEQILEWLTKSILPPEKKDETVEKKYDEVDKEDLEKMIQLIVGVYSFANNLDNGLLFKIKNIPVPMDVKSKINKEYDAWEKKELKDLQLGKELGKSFNFTPKKKKGVIGIGEFKSLNLSPIVPKEEERKEKKEVEPKKLEKKVDEDVKMEDKKSETPKKLEKEDLPDFVKDKLQKMKKLRIREMELENEKIKRDTEHLFKQREKVRKKIDGVTNSKIITSLMKLLVHPACSKVVSKNCIKVLDSIGKLDPDKRKIILKNLCETIKKESREITFKDTESLEREIRFCRLIQSYTEIYHNVKKNILKKKEEMNHLKKTIKKTDEKEKKDIPEVVEKIEEKKVEEGEGEEEGEIDDDDVEMEDKKKEPDNEFDREIKALQFFEPTSLNIVWMNLNFMLQERDVDYSVPSQKTSKLIPIIESFFSFHSMFLEKKKKINVAKSRNIELKDVTFTEPTTPNPGSGQTPMDQMSVDRKVNTFFKLNKEVLNSLIQLNPTLVKDTEFRILLDYPQYLSFQNKVSWFRSQIKEDQLRSGYRRKVVPIKVRRENIFQDTFYQLSKASPQDLKGKIRVTFMGEPGVDSGGLTREFFLLLSQKLISAKYGLFSSSADGTTYQPNPNSGFEPDHLTHFKFVSRIIALSVYNQQLLDCYFTRSFYKHILGRKISVQDLESIDPGYYKNLQWILKNSIEGTLDLTFALEVDKLGKITTVDLKKNGRNIKVTDKNKEEYVLLVTQQKMTGLIEKQLKAFLGGFYEIIPKRLITIFDSEELELLMNGLHEFDVDDLRLNTEYRGGYNKDTRVIKHFWTWLGKLKRNQKAKFLQFVTGTSKIPLGGFKNLLGADGEQKMSIHKVSNTEALPTSHTCFNQLDLPEYESYEQLEKMCSIAIEEGSQGFGFV